MTIFYTVIAFIAILCMWMGIKIVPQQQSWIVEKLGKYDRTLNAGLNFLIPFIERVAYRHSLKEEAIDISEQTAITRDNVTLRIDGILYIKITDPVDASYGVTDPYFAIAQLAQTTMRSEIGKMPLDKTFEERDTMNVNIVSSINEASANWGVQCMRYEIKDITPPSTVLKAMELQVAADRQKRADILESEGKQQSQINLAEAQKQEVVLHSEAAKTDHINRAQGEAEAIRLVAIATAESIATVAETIGKPNGKDAVSLKVAEQYVDAFSQLAQKSTTLLLPANTNNAATMVAEALSVYKQLSASDATTIEDKS